jgi:hypothetical protein
MQTILKWLNDQHWFIIASIILVGLFFWVFGCESQCKSLIDPAKQVTRGELKAEIEYLAGIADVRIADLDKQDQIKQELLNAVNIIGTGGTINPAGLVNLAASIGAIAWGLNRNQQLKNALKKTTDTDSA